VRKISIFSKIFRFRNEKSKAVSQLKLVTERGNSVYVWNGKAYDNDIVRSCLAPYTKAVGKLVGKHIYSSPSGVKTNPEPYIKTLLEYPNPLMSAQKFQEKMAAQLILNGNAFASITRDENGYPTELYPLPATGVEAEFRSGRLYLHFLFENGNSHIFSYDDIIHLRTNFYDNDVFGNSLMPSLANLLQISDTIDGGIIKAVKNSSVIRWLLKVAQTIRKDDLKQIASDFSESFLSTESSTGGVAAIDPKIGEAIQVSPKDYVPNFEIYSHTRSRIFCLFGVSEAIVSGSYTEDEWNSFYEASIEPIALDLSSEMTRKLFTAGKRSYGNKIIYESANLACSTTQTRLDFLQMVDRGAMTPNEWRQLFNLAPVEGGDIPIRRLDTAPTTEGGEHDGNSGQRHDHSR